MKEGFEKAKEVLQGLDDATKIDMYNMYMLRSMSSYIFREGDYYELAGCSKIKTDLCLIENAMLSKEITVSDFFIAYAVAMLGCADKESLINYLTWLHKKSPDKVIAVNEYIGKRIDALARCGVIRKVVLRSQNGDLRANAFVISKAGAEATRLALNLVYLKYDSGLLLSGAYGAGICLVVGRILSRLINSPASLEINTNVKMYSKAISSKYNIYAHVTAESEENKTLLIVEPVLFGIVRAVETENDVMKKIKLRMSLLANEVAEIVNAQEDKKYDDIRVIFSVEDYNALTKVVKMVIEQSILLAEHSYFTSDRLIAANGNYLCRSFYKIVYTDSKPKIVLEKDNSQIFGTDDGENIQLKEEHIIKMHCI